jgi:hypothetical protein
VARAAGIGLAITGGFSCSRNASINSIISDINDW